MDPAEIIRIAREIQASRLPASERKSHYEFLYADFAQKYPAILEMCCNARSPADLAHLEYMVGQWKKVQDGNVSQYDASVKVGTRLMDTYIKPVLPDTPKGL
jgi:hypothetical protein